MNLAQRLSHLPREARDTLFLLAVVACCVAPLAAYLPLWTSALTAALLGWRGWLAVGARALPGRWVIGALLAAAVALTLLSHRTIVGRDAGVTLIVVLLALKTLELRARRDAMVVFFLGFFTLLANFFFSQSLPTAAALLVALLGLLTALVNAHMPVGRPPLAASMRTAARMALLGAPIMVALFLLFPRMAPLWGVPDDARSGRSGLSGEMSIGSMASLVLDDSVALRVRFDTPGGAPPPQSSLYFRGPVLTAFNGRDWYALSQPEARGITWAYPTPANLQMQGESVRYEVTLEPSRRPWLLTLDAVQERPELPQGTGAMMSPELLWSASRPISSVLRYRAESHLRFTHGPTRRTSLLNGYVELPAEMNPRTLALAEQMQADPTIAARVAASGAQAYIDAALARLRTGGYTYTLEPGVYGEHTADEFWFDRKEGFCEHIASAFVVLMRALDVPSRIVTGYQGASSTVSTATGPCARATHTPGPRSGWRAAAGCAWTPRGPCRRGASASSSDCRRLAACWAPRWMPSSTLRWYAVCGRCGRP
ncbi:transglutaminaseTgpA domain-containing protein [Diaphorobacter nitroreducens]|uniref:transglutaminase family protein n=1 Tax=Diaphorobacter nitroreducens TaxID=164759 RepID=UPI002680920F